MFLVCWSVETGILWHKVPLVFYPFPPLARMVPPYLITIIGEHSTT